MNKTSLYLAHGVVRRILLAITASLPVAVWAQSTDAGQTHAISDAHIALALVTSVVLLLAFVLAVVLSLQTRRLHHLKQAKKSMLDQLPPVLRLEKFLFQVLLIGFILLTVLIASGMYFGEAAWGRTLIFNHKVVFTLLAWLVFAVLLVGRYIRGWRGQTAIRATIFGFALLFLGYAGTHFVMDVILKR